MAHATHTSPLRGNALKWIVIGFLVIFGIFLLSGLIRWISSDSGQSTGSATSSSISEGSTTSMGADFMGEEIGTIRCSPNEETFAKTGGWCMSETLEPGTYRLRLRSANLETANWIGEEIVSYTKIPPHGLAISTWRGQAFERVWRAQAPVPGMGRVAAPIARIDLDPPFNPAGRTITLGRPGKIGVGFNIIPVTNDYKGNRGEIVMDILRLE